MIIPKNQVRILLFAMLAIFLTVNLIENSVLAQAVFKGDQAEAFFEGLSLTPIFKNKYIFKMFGKEVNGLN